MTERLFSKKSKKTEACRNYAAGMEEKAAGFIRQEEMIQKGDRVLAGVSGGADSVCLLMILHSLQTADILPSFRLRVLHVHHGLRKSAEEDMRYVSELCAGLGVPCKCVCVDASAYARKHHCGIEEGARILRYEEFERYCEAWEKEDGAGRRCRVAVAHHLEDQAETVLFHMVRGSRIAGMAGMRPVTGRVIRPLLEFTREEIEKYLQEKRISWKEDETNEDIRYSRNLLRKEIVPLLTKINSGAQRHIAQLASEAAETEDYLRLQTEKALVRCAQPVNMESSCTGDLPPVNIPALLKEPPLLQRRVVYSLIADASGRKKDLHDTHVRAVLDLCTAGGSGRLSLPGGVCAVHEYDHLWILRSGENGKKKSAGNAAENHAPYPLSADEYVCRIFPFNGDMSAIPQNKYTKWLNYDKIAKLPIFRTRLPGDRICLKEEGTEFKKLSRCMVDAKIPASVRDLLVFPMKEQDVLWIPGRRIHAGYKVMPQTSEILEIRWLPGAEKEEKAQKT